MLASLLNKRIKVEIKDTSINSLGTPIDVYSDLKYSWGEEKQLSGDSQFTEDGILVFSTAEVTLRYDPSIDYKCRLYYDIQYHKINHIRIE